MGQQLTIIIGCDIAAYSKLRPGEQILVRAHLRACHIRAEAFLQLTQKAHNDTGDGFWVIFGDHDSFVPFVQYMDLLGRLYEDDCFAAIKKVVKDHPLKLVAHFGSVYIDASQGICGDGINNAERLLAESRPRRTLVSGAFVKAMLDRDSQAFNGEGDGMSTFPSWGEEESPKLYVPREAPIWIVDKHGKKSDVAALPMRISSDLKNCKIWWDIWRSPLYVLKTSYFDSKLTDPTDPAQGKDLISHLNHYYGRLLDLQAENLEHLCCCYSIGHVGDNVWIGIERFLECLAFSEPLRTCKTAKFVLCLLNPTKEEARTKDGHGNVYAQIIPGVLTRTKSMVDTWLAKKVRSKEDQRIRLEIANNIDSKIEIRLADTLVPLGGIKIGDIMLLTDYGTKKPYRWDNAKKSLLRFESDPEKNDPFANKVEYLANISNNSEPILFSKLEEWVINNCIPDYPGTDSASKT